MAMRLIFLPDIEVRGQNTTTLHNRPPQSPTIRKKIGE